MGKLDVKPTSLKKVLMIVPPTIFEDYRGLYIETYNEKLYNQEGIDVKFVADSFIISDKNVLRGIHGDSKTWKLVNCLHGRFYIVIINCDESSLEFGKWASFTLSETNRKQLLVPPKHGIAHLILSEKVVYHYKQSTFLEDKKEFTYRWDDPRFNIMWPIKEPILSEKDKKAELISK